MDRRTIYTKNVLKETLIELMKKNHISKISVKKICEIADVNRSTFYAHYKDVYDLLSQIELDTIIAIKNLVFDKPEQDRIPYESLCILFEYAAQNSTMFEILLSERSELAFRDELIIMVKQLGLVENRIKTGNKKMASKYLQLYSINGTLSVLSEWLRTGRIESVEEIANIINSLNRDMNINSL